MSSSDRASQPAARGRVNGRFRWTMATVLTFAAWLGSASAQQRASGFDVARLYLTPPEAGWFVMDGLDWPSALGGAVSLTAGYSRNPLRVRTPDGLQRLVVVSDLSVADFGFAATYDRFRLSLAFDWILDVDGSSGTVGRYAFTAPTTGLPLTASGVNPSTAPDALGDVRIGIDVRLLGRASSAFRLGAGAQLFIPSPNTSRREYVTDGTYRGMLRLLFAGDAGPLSYAAQMGVHLRPLDDASAPGSPEGSEFLFGLAARTTLALGEATSLSIGPELYGESAIRALFGSATGVEALLTSQFERTTGGGARARIKLGAGGGLDSRFGAPAWLAVVAVEVLGQKKGAAW